LTKYYLSFEEVLLRVFQGKIEIYKNEEWLLINTNKLSSISDKEIVLNGTHSYLRIPKQKVWIYLI